MMKRRAGFTMLEMVATAAFMAIIVVSLIATSDSVSTLRTNTRDTVYLSVHNLNCMERLRQMCLSADSGLLYYYGDSDFGTTDIETEIFIERAEWDSFNIYSVRIESKIRESRNRLVADYVLTDIGATVLRESVNGES